jgi:hypothetical protein
MSTQATATKRWAGLRIRILGTHLAVATLLAASAVGVPAGQAAGTETDGAGVARAWVDRALQAVRSGSPAAHTGTPGAARTYAMTTTAMYDAVNGIDVANGTSTRKPAVLPGYESAPAGASRPAAASAAAHAVLTSLFRANGSVTAALDAGHATELDGFGRGDPAVEAGRTWGAEVGHAIVAARSNDGTQTPEVQPAG